MKKIFVTGATGMVGSNLVKKLVEQGQNVSILIRKNSTHPYLESLKLDIHYGDILDITSIDRAIKGAEYVYHVAGKISYSKWDKDELYKVNIIGTENVMEAAIKNNVKKIVITSSTGAVGIPEGKNIVDEEYFFANEYNKIPYMATKHEAEKLALSYISKGIDVVAVCPSTIYGSGDIKMNMGELIKNIKREKLPMSPVGGNSLISVSDCVEGHILAMEKGKSGERYILASENLKTIDLINLIADILNVKRVNKTIPNLLLPILKFAAIISENVFRSHTINPAIIMFSAKNRYFNSNKAQKELGWQPKQPIQEAIIEAIQFYEKYNLF